MSDRIRNGEQGYEKDKNFAHATAIFLNALHRKGVLTSKDLANPTDDMISELAMRTHRGRMTANAHYLDLQDFNKLERMFMSENVNTEGYPTKDETINFSREFMKSLKSDYPEITGMIIFGSLVSNNKLAGPGSDLDVILLLNETKTNVSIENRMLGEGDIEHDPTDVIVTGSRYENLDGRMREFVLENDYKKFHYIHLSVNHVFNEQVFNEYVNPKNADEKSWWYMFGNAYAIGSVGNLTASQIEKKIVESQNSEVLLKTKRRIMDKIRKDVRFKDRNY